MLKSSTREARLHRNDFGRILCAQTVFIHCQWCSVMSFRKFYSISPIPCIPSAVNSLIDCRRRDGDQNLHAILGESSIKPAKLSTHMLLTKMAQHIFPRSFAQRCSFDTIEMRAPRRHPQPPPPGWVHQNGQQDNLHPALCPLVSRKTHDMSCMLP